MSTTGASWVSGGGVEDVLFLGGLCRETESTTRTIYI